MKKNFSIKYIICSMALFLVFIFTACGKKAPPQPPAHEEPHSIFNNVCPNVAKVEDTAGPRLQGRNCSRLPQRLDNAGDTMSSAFPKGKQHSKKGVSIGHYQQLDLMTIIQSTQSLWPRRLTYKVMCCLCNNRACLR
jgi:hypothetical protein